MGAFIPNMNFLCLSLWLGGVWTDDTNTGDDDAQHTKNDCIRLFGC